MRSNKEAPLRLYRMIDANLNRLREGIRVIEDICRYIFDEKELATQLKLLRHKARFEDETLLLQARDIQNDVLKDSIASEMERSNLHSIIKANIKRAQESARVLEEITKLLDPKIAEKFKTIRYELYDIEVTLQKTLQFG